MEDHQSSDDHHEITTMVPKPAIDIDRNLDRTSNLSDSDHQITEKESAETETESCTKTSPAEACTDCTDGEHTKSSNSDGKRENSYYSDSSNSYDNSYQGDEDQYTYQSYDSFEATYNCHPLSLVGKSHLENGDQIVMPASSLETLLRTRVDYPMLFEIRNESKGRVSHCGVSEFTAEEGTVFLPKWMMDNLKLQDGQPVNLKNASLPRATFAKLQPHSVDFLQILNPKAALEEALSSIFFCLTTGDTIRISYNFKDFYIDVVETKPSAAVCIIDIDCEVDFAPPLDYREPEKPEEPSSTNGSKFKPFTGVARRLNDPAAEMATPGSTPALEENQTIDADRNAAAKSEFRAHRSTGKLVFASGSSGRKLKNVEKDSKAETPEEKRFQPFTGKKYSLSS